MSEIQLALIFSISSLLLNGYLFWLYFERSRKRHNMAKEIESYFDIMHKLGYEDKEWIAEQLMDFKTYKDLQKHNKKYKQKIK